MLDFLTTNKDAFLAVGVILSSATSLFALFYSQNYQQKERARASKSAWVSEFRDALSEWLSLISVAEKKRWDSKSYADEIAYREALAENNKAHNRLNFLNEKLQLLLDPSKPQSEEMRELMQEVRFTLGNDEEHFVARSKLVGASRRLIAATLSDSRKSK